jgi:octaprenyl-diphosphate synthase
MRKPRELLLGLAHPFVMADHLVDDEAQELLGKIGVKLGCLGQIAQAGDLALLAARVGGRQAMLGLVRAHRLRDLEPFGEQEDERRVDIVDALAKAFELLVGHGPLPRSGLCGRAFADASLLAFGAASGQRLPPMASVTPLRRNAPASLDPMVKLVAGDMNQVNSVILARMQSDVPLIPELAGHLIAGGGKRMRPMLTLACARLLDYHGTRHHCLAACVEFIHTATLLHDDVVDGSNLRRGRRTANLIWGNAASVLVGDFLFSRSFELMVEDGSLRVLRILSGASSIIAQGEVDQLTAQRQVETSEAHYLRIIDAKTAALFAAACRIAAVVAERDEAVEQALDAYGRNLGIAFQLVDDAIDYASDDATMGKDAGDDFRDGKVTLPVILAYARGSDSDRRFWRDAMEGIRNSDEDLAHATRLMVETGAIADTLARARHYGQLAIDSLAGIGGGTARAALIEAVEFAVARAY